MWKLIQKSSIMPSPIHADTHSCSFWEEILAGRDRLSSHWIQLMSSAPVIEHIPAFQHWMKNASPGTGLGGWNNERWVTPIVIL